MARKQRFPPEPVTNPDVRRSKAPSPHSPQSGRAPKEYRARAEAPTLPPPTLSPTVPPPTRRAGKGGRPSREVHVSDVRPVGRDVAAATVDEVTADMSKDPRREKEDE